MPQKKKKQGRGRPNLPDGEAKTELLRVRVTGPEMAGYEAKAKRAKLALPEWVRKRLTAAP